jgi:hypothetical protein
MKKSQEIPEDEEEITPFEVVDRHWYDECKTKI